jgi:hypothetical protein
MKRSHPIIISCVCAVLALGSGCAEPPPNFAPISIIVQLAGPTGQVVPETTVFVFPENITEALAVPGAGPKPLNSGRTDSQGLFVFTPTSDRPIRLDVLGDGPLRTTSEAGPVIRPGNIAQHATIIVYPRNFQANITWTVGPTTSLNSQESWRAPIPMNDWPAILARTRELSLEIAWTNSATAFGSFVPALAPHGGNPIVNGTTSGGGPNSGSVTNRLELSVAETEQFLAEIRGAPIDALIVSNSTFGLEPFTVTGELHFLLKGTSVSGLEI